VTSRSVFQVIALFAALLFVAHPIQTQAITYIVQRYASLATLFYLLSIVAYIKGRLTSDLSERAKIPWFLISFLAAVAAMESKEIAFTLPFMIALYEFTFFRGPILRRLRYLSLIATTSLIIPLYFALPRLISSPTLVTLSGVLKENSLTPRDLYLYSQFKVITTYIRLIFLPINQTLDYDHYHYYVKKFFEFGVIAPLFLLLSIIILALYLHLRGLHKKQPLLCLIAFGVYWFFIALSVESSIIPISDLIFEHRVYLPSVGAFIAIAAGSVLALGWFSRRLTALRHAVPAVIVLSIAAYSVATLARNAVWKDAISINRDNVKKSPLRGRAHNNLGHAYFKQGLYELAAHEFSTAIKLDPSIAPAEVYYNLGLSLRKLHRLDEAVAAFEKASQKEPENFSLYNKFRAAVAERDRLKR
jgi:tetratricopeptide (TPR) repeat protein